MAQFSGKQTRHKNGCPRSRRVALVSESYSKHDEDAPGPSQLGTGEVADCRRARRVRTLFVLRPFGATESHALITKHRHKAPVFPRSPVPLADHSVEKAQTLYRPKTTHREAEHENNPPHRTVSNPRNISPKQRKDPKIALFKTRLYPSIPVKPHFSIDSKPLIKIKLYSPENPPKFISVSQYSSIPVRQ